MKLMNYNYMKLDTLLDGGYFIMSVLSATGAYLATYGIMKGEVMEGLGCAAITLIPLSWGSNILDNIRENRIRDKEIKSLEDKLKEINRSLEEREAY